MKLLRDRRPRPSAPDEIVDGFHRLYYDSPARTWQNTYWLGVPVQKNPLDLWVYQEILFEVRPRLIIECGTLYGGSALYLARMCDLLETGRVVTIDIQDFPNRPKHPRIEYVLGYTTAPETVARLQQAAAGEKPVLVILDSDHHRDHVLAEMRAYADLITPGSYLIVEDGNINGHPVYQDYGPGPWEAIDRFLEERSDFAVDREREKFFFTFNPRGYLRKAAAPR